MQNYLIPKKIYLISHTATLLHIQKNVNQNVNQNLNVKQKNVNQNVTKVQVT